MRIFKEVVVDGKHDTTENTKMNRAVEAVKYTLRNAKTELFLH